MTVNEALISIVVLLGVVATWRLFRWRFRPDLAPDSKLCLEAGELLLNVRNMGAATARRCRGNLLRADRRIDGEWIRMDADPGRFPIVWRDGAGERDLRRNETASLVVARSEGLPPGGYRLELTVIDGEERRVILEFRWPFEEEKGEN